MAKLDPIVSEFATTEEAEAHDAWVRAKVREALADTRPPVPHDQAVARIDAVLAKFEKKA
ncbi:type II toxin-antitoxin system RelB family antitoxin [Brevundimonas sp.]|uniref:type II toxin-antitoxin system RelB family antitoxin n=1 Tax=Brevundimonas sp. TaxID=1871086 RepID=UPI002FD95D10